MPSKFRIEKDSLGRIKVPRDAYWGAQTQRAIENFQISGLRLPPEFIRAQAVIKLASATSNTKLGKLSMKLGDAITVACEEVMQGKLDSQFVVDAYQAGAGTSQNMNINEVVANRANELLGKKKG